jgi:hypothetical protein
LAVCCLEQGFGIPHAPIIPIEVLLCGTCLVGSIEVLQKLPGYPRLPNGCIDIADVNNVESLSERLAALVENPRLAATVGSRGCNFARELQRDTPFPQALERILDAAAGRRRVPSRMLWSADGRTANHVNNGLPITRSAGNVVAQTDGVPVPA